MRQKYCIETEFARALGSLCMPGVVVGTRKVWWSILPTAGYRKSGTREVADGRGESQTSHTSPFADGIILRLLASGLGAPSSLSSATLRNVATKQRAPLQVERGTTRYPVVAPGSTFSPTSDSRRPRPIKPARLRKRVSEWAACAVLRDVSLLVR